MFICLAKKNYVNWFFIYFYLQKYRHNKLKIIKNTFIYVKKVKLYTSFIKDKSLIDEAENIYEDLKFKIFS